MKRQINYILMQIVLWSGWLIEYFYFLEQQFQTKFDFWIMLAYIFLLYLCVVRKLGNNNNRRYEIYMELWGRLAAINVIWYLFAGKKLLDFERFFQISWKLAVLSTVQCYETLSHHNGVCGYES